MRAALGKEKENVLYILVGTLKRREYLVEMQGISWIHGTSPKLVIRLVGFGQYFQTNHICTTTLNLRYLLEGMHLPQTIP